jgi:nucleotide-binding universal stress UspA family protein
MAFQNVLALTDGSEFSRKALRYAVEICHRFGARLYLLTVIEKPPSFVTGEVSREILEATEDALRSELGTCSIYCETSGLSCHAEVRKGHAFEEIIRYAEEIDADLIVMSTHGRTGLPHVLLGSVAGKVVRHAPCPVMTIRLHAKELELGPQGSCDTAPHED